MQISSNSHKGIKKYSFPTEEKDITKYVEFAKNFPVLEPKEELTLIQEYKIYKDKNALQKIILSYFRLLVSICCKLINYKISFADLIQEAIKGLIKAVNNFDRNKNKSLASFAKIWIKSELYKYILQNISIIRLDKNKDQKKLFFALKKFSLLPVEQVGQITKLDTSKILDFKNALHVINPDDDEKKVRTYVKSSYKSPEDIAIGYNNKEIVYKALNSLDERSRDIIQSRFLNKDNKISLSNLSKKYNISIERIRQIELKALLKLKKKFEQLYNATCEN